MLELADRTATSYKEIPTRNELMPIARLFASQGAIASRCIVTLALALTSTFAVAQVPNSDVAPGHADPYAHDPYVTSSGATVPNPGKSQSGGTTPQERAIQRQNNRIDKEICKGC